MTIASDEHVEQVRLVHFAAVLVRDCRIEELTKILLVDLSFHALHDLEPPLCAGLKAPQTSLVLALPVPQIGRRDEVLLLLGRKIFSLSS